MLQRYLALLLLSGIFFLEFFQTKSLAHPATAKIEQYLEQGRTEKASALLQEFLPKTPHDPELLGLSALIRVNKGDLEAAITFYDQALTYWADSHERLVNLNNYLLALKYQERLLNEQLKFLEIDDKLTEVKEVKGKIANNRQGQTTIRRNIAEVIPNVVTNETVAQGYLNIGEIKKAQEALLKSFPSPAIIPLYIEIAKQQENPIPLLLKGLDQADLVGKVKVLTALAQYDLTYLSEAIAYAQQAQMDEYLFQLYALQAKQGIDAKRSLKLAVSALSRLRRKLTSPHPEVTFFFQDKVVPVYRNYLAILLENPTQKDLIEAREVFDRLQIAQVENLFKQLCITQKVELEKILAQKKAGLMQIIVLDDEYHILLSLPSGEIKHRKVAISASTLAETLINWRRELGNSLAIDYQLAAINLYQEIIAPFLVDIQSLDQLLFIGDEYFRSVPLGALNNGQQYLIEKLPITTLLSWNLLVNRVYERGNLLAFGLAEARAPFVNAIPYAEDEVKAIAQILPDSAVFVGSNFTEKALREELWQKDPQLLHLATHAIFTGDPQNSTLATFDRPINLLELENLLRLPQSLRLLVLSACETSQGNNLATLGLAGVAARGGVETTMGSLWQSDDQETLKLMVNFYQGLAQGENPARALQQAQVKAIETGQHPAFWSLFLLIGG